MTQMGALRTPFIAVNNRAPAAVSGGTNAIGLFAARPAAGTAGNLFTCTDSVTGLWVDDGAAWRPFVGPNNFVGYEPPAATSFTQVGASSATLTKTRGALQYVENNANDAFTDNTALNAAWRVEMAIEALWTYGGAGGQEGLCGLIARNSTSGNFTRFSIYNNNTDFTVQVQRFTSLAVAGAVQATQIASTKFSPVGPFLAIDQGAVNVTYQYSINGKTWRTFYTEAKAAFITVDQAGLYQGNTAGVPQVVDIAHYKLT